MSKELLLHIGITKTGSSYLQSCAALNQAFLLSRGIDYPPMGVEEAFFANARKGIVTGGNGEVINQYVSANSEENLQRLLLDSSNRLNCFDITNRTLVSYEGLCNNVFANINCLKLLTDCASNAGYSHIKCLLVVRNPYEHMCSWFLEGLKGTGWAAFTSIEEYAVKYDDLSDIARAITNTKELGIELKCINYSICKNELLSYFLEWAGVLDADSITVATPTKPVNRSLNSVEQIICQALAEHGITPALFASELLNSELVTGNEAMSGIRDSIPYIDPAALDAMESRNLSSAEFINLHLQESNHIKFNRGYFPSKDADKLTITKMQLRSIVSTFASLLEQHTTSKPWKIDIKG
jgi:hypothetical protein